MDKAHMIVERARELGYDSCGIIPIGEVGGYADRLTERIERSPADAENYKGFYRFARPQEAFPWAKSIIVCARRYGKYRIPPHLQGVIAKYYLVDGRRDENSPDYKASVAFEGYLESLGLRLASERSFGLTALRWAAHKAGIGLIRRNNFFYTKSGSWVHLEAWLADEEMELRAQSDLKPCPPNCDKCVKSCPTGSLKAPYTMSRSACVSALTTWDGNDFPSGPFARQVGGWIYGCDACQDACPHNAGKWTQDEEFPFLDELAGAISPEKILDMDYDFLLTKMQPKFFYIRPDRLWKWKLNALNAMFNNYDPGYESAVRRACEDADERVRNAALFIREKKGKATP